MKHDCMHLPDKLETEDAELMHRFCSMYAPEDEFDEEAWKEFFDKNASHALKRAKKAMQRIRERKQDNVRI